jgi:hypothetical protein
MGMRGMWQNLLPQVIMEHDKTQNIAIYEEQSGSKFTRYTPSSKESGQLSQ